MYQYCIALPYGGYRRSDSINRTGLALLLVVGMRLLAGIQSCT